MKHILVIDDNRLNLRIAEDTLKEHFKISTLSSGIEGLKFLKSHSVDLILLDIEMPELDGIETMMLMKQDDMINNIPVIFLTSITDRDVEARCLTLGAQDFIVKPFHKPAILMRVQRVLELVELRTDLERKVMQKTEELERLTVQTITTFANAIDAKDAYTKGHSVRVAKYSKAIAQNLGWSDYGTKNLFYTALLHDIGKIGIPDYILNKSDRLSNEEYDIIKKHPEIGGHILEDVIVVPYLGVGAYHHHERYDGTGYPNGRKGEDIPLIGRIIGVADAVDAMMSDRAYRSKLPLSHVIGELTRCRGTQFDPTIVDIMINILQTGAGVDFENDDDPLINNNTLLLKVINNYVNFSKIDALTGLWNSLYLEEHMDDLIKETDIPCAFLIMDIDNFKDINSTWGHLAGDSLLANASATILSSLRKMDIACRLGGDEFGIFLYKVENSSYVEHISKLLILKIWEKLRDLHTPMAVTASIGIAMYPSDGTTYTELHRNATTALKFAKQSGKNNSFFYSQIMGRDPAMSLTNNYVNIATLKTLLEEKNELQGAYLVDRKDFQKIYQLMSRMNTRSSECVQIILFTLTSDESDDPSDLELQEGFKWLVPSVKESLRIGDVATKFNRSQYIVLLKGAETEGSTIVVERIVNQYNMLRSLRGLKLVYELDQL